MLVKTVIGVGCVVLRGPHEGTYELRTWLRWNDSAESQQDVYPCLTAGELSDVLAETVAGAMPGYQLIDGCLQPPLWT